MRGVLVDTDVLIDFFRNINPVAEAGLLRREYGPSHGISLADALIAGNCWRSFV